MAEAARGYCLFQMGGRGWAVDLRAVVQVLEPGPLARIPLQAPRVLGFRHHRGQVIPVTRPAAPIDCRDRDDRAEHVVLLLDTERGPWGLAIDRRGVEVVERGIPRDLGDERAAVGVEVQGVLTHGSRDYLLIALEPTWRALRREVDEHHEQWAQPIGAGVPSGSQTHRT